MPTYQFGLRVWEIQPDAMRDAHRHNDIELIYVADGQIHYLYHAQNLHLKAGHLILFWAAIPHQLRRVIETCTLYIITLPLNVFLRWRLHHSMNALMRGIPFIQTNTASVSNLIDATFKQWVYDLKMLSPEKEIIVLLEIQALIRRISLHQEQSIHNIISPQSDTRVTHAQQIANMISQHYTEPLSLQMIADDVKLHPSYVSTLFANVFHMTLWNYLTQYRIAHAQRLLLLTDTPIENIAIASGFTSISQFYATFKKYTQQSPKQFRNAKL
ncbi:MAG: helix-turn-helix domain-containing protein [Chloroflexota bacterium]